MKTLIIVAMVCIVSVSTLPVNKEEDSLVELTRERRSPQNKGSVVVTGQHTQAGQGAPKQSSARVDYNHKIWEGRNGARLDGNAYYQRNWGGGPRQDYGAGVKLTVPFGGRRN